MRWFEIVLLAALGAGLLVWISRRHRSTLRKPFLISSAVAAAALPLHLLIEGARWQMSLAYVLVVILGVVAFLTWKNKDGAAPVQKRSWVRRVASWTGAGVLALFLVAAAVLPALFPVDVLPEPTGPYAIGSTRFFVSDPLREEPFTAQPDRRTLDVWVWYPAAPGAPGDRDHIWGEPGLIAGELSSALRLPSWLLSHLALAPAHSQANAPIASGAPFPTIVFSHGYAQGFAGQNSALFEDLASHGYVVIAINHPHEGMLSARPDGSFVRGNQAQFERLGREIGEVMGPAIEEVGRTQDPARAETLMRDMIRRVPVANRSLRLWVADIDTVLDRLPEINSGRLAPQLRGAIDETRLALMGMSFGAAATTEACITDPRCRAAVNLDGTPLGSVLDQRTAKPVLFLVGGNAAVNRSNLTIYRRTGPGSHYAVVEGARHLDFSDLSLISPIFQWLGALGPIGGAEVNSVMRDYTRAFLDTELKGQPSRLAAVAEAHPRVRSLSR